MTALAGRIRVRIRVRVPGDRAVGGCVALAGAVLLAGWPAAAAAHVGGPPPSDAPYYQTALTGITPRPAGVAASVAANGEWVQLTVTVPTEVVVVSGYGGEPYLRVTSTTVWQNDISPTRYLNQSLFVDTSALNGKPGSAAPEWRRVGTRGVVRWHDHRIHWMGVGRPPTVAADPTHRHLIGDWTIPASVGTERFTIRGTLSWIGKPTQVFGMPPRIAVALLLATCVGLLLTAVVVRSARRPAAAAGRPAQPATWPPLPHDERGGSRVTERSAGAGDPDRERSPGRR